MKLYSEQKTLLSPAIVRTSTIVAVELDEFIHLFGELSGACTSARLILVIRNRLLLLNVS